LPFGDDIVRRTSVSHSQKWLATYQTDRAPPAIAVLSATTGIAIHQLRLFTNDLDKRKASQVDLAPGFA
jgi:hypothetical protein